MKLHNNTVLRRCVAMLLVVMMCVSLLNLTAFAEGVCRQHSFGTPQNDPNTGEPYVQCSCGKICHQIDNDGHKFVTSTVLPTCEDAGCIKYTCPECDYYEEETIPALGHDYGDWTVVTKATYTKPGLEQRICSRDSRHVATRVIPQLTCEHKNLSVNEKNPSCTEGGSKEYRCTDCNQVVDTAISPALGHDLVFKWEAKAPTCTETGLAKYDCTRCSYSEEREIPAKGHVCPDQVSWDEDHHWSECKVCHDVIGEKKAHTWTEVYRIPATCTESGEVKWDCALDGCNASKVEILSATGHNWDEGTVLKPATVNEAGIIRYTCKNDPSHIITEWIPMLENTCDHKNGNKVDIEHRIEPTCTEVGWEYHVCIDCGWLMDKKPIPALGHKWGPWQDTGDPLKHFRHCERENCDYEETGIHENWETFTKAPSCTEDGYTEKKCADCDYSETTVIPATGHEWGDFVSEGEKGHQKECAKCGSHENGKHNYVESFTKEPTCTENGYKEEKCTDCGYAKMTEIPATGHEWGNFVSEGEKGHQRECAKCGSHENDDHHFNEGEQATEDGKNGIKFTCQDCGYSYFVPEDETVTVTWVDEDGTVLHQLENVKLEEIPAGDQYAALSGKQNPTKAEGADYTYAFSGWDRTVDAEGNVTYTAQYTPTRKPVSPPINIIILPTPSPTPDPDEDIEDPDVPLGTPRPEEPTPTPDPGEDIGDPDVPLGTPDPGEDIEDPDVPLGTPKPEPTPDPDEELEDPDVPLNPAKPEATPVPDEEDIPDGNVPLASTPKTGDDMPVWMTLATLSAAGLIFMGISRKKRKKI